MVSRKSMKRCGSQPQYLGGTSSGNRAKAVDGESGLQSSRHPLSPIRDLVACYHTAPRLPPRKVVRTTQNASAKHQPACRYRGTDPGHVVDGVAGRNGSSLVIYEMHIAPTINELQMHVIRMQRVTSCLKSQLRPLPALIDHASPRHDTRDIAVLRSRCSP